MSICPCQHGNLCLRLESRSLCIQARYFVHIQDSSFSSFFISSTLYIYAHLFELWLLFLNEEEHKAGSVPTRTFLFRHLALLITDDSALIDIEEKLSISTWVSFHHKSDKWDTNFPRNRQAFSFRNGFFRASQPTHSSIP